MDEAYWDLRGDLQKIWVECRSAGRREGFGRRVIGGRILLKKDVLLRSAVEIDIDCFASEIVVCDREGWRGLRGRSLSFQSLNSGLGFGAVVASEGIDHVQDKGRALFDREVGHEGNVNGNDYWLLTGTGLEQGEEDKKECGKQRGGVG